MSNPVEAWLTKEISVRNLLVEIQGTGDDIEGTAEVAFHRLCALLDIPKMPEDLARYNDFYTAKDIYSPRSVYEELALLHFLEPDDDLRGLVLMAVYNVKHLLQVDIKYVARKHFKRKIPKSYCIGFKGEHSKVEIIFLKENDNWLDLGCKAIIKGV